VVAPELSPRVPRPMPTERQLKLYLQKKSHKSSSEMRMLYGLRIDTSWMELDWPVPLRAWLQGREGEVVLVTNRSSPAFDLIRVGKCITLIWQLIVASLWTNLTATPIREIPRGDMASFKLVVSAAGRSLHHISEDELRSIRARRG